MSTTKKIRGDSVLGTLPEDRQAEIASHANSHTLAETIAWLKADGIRISSGALSRWLSSWLLRQRFQLADADTLEFLQMLRTARPSMPESELQQWGSDFFQLQAVKENNPKVFLAYAKARTKGKIDAEKLALQKGEAERDERRLRLLEQKAAQADAAKKALNDEALSETEKQQRIRQIFGMA